MGDSERDGREESEDEDGGRWSGGKVRAVTEVEIEREGRGNSIVLYRKVDDGTRMGQRELLGISFVPVRLMIRTL